jgi:hypothetical protein
MYNGKEVCQGCKRPGTEIGRWRKVDLCPECADQIKAGRAELTYNSIEYVHVPQHFHAFRNREVNQLAHDLLSSISIQGVKVVAWNKPLKSCFGDNTRDYKIPLRFYEPLQKFCLETDKVLLELKENLEVLPRIAREEVEKERTKIFNEGVEHGKDLLFRLNDGTIGMEDFNKRIVSYKNK